MAVWDRDEGCSLFTVSDVDTNGFMCLRKAKTVNGRKSSET